VATRLFLEGGILAVGVDRIVEQARVATMTQYRHVGGKDGLVVAALEQWSAEFRRAPAHPAWKAIANHRMAVQQLLEDLVKPLDVPDPAAAGGPAASAPGGRRGGRGRGRAAGVPAWWLPCP
jgi:AcrR family transcriptional regulator